jgi:hypothetical protein
MKPVSTNQSNSNRQADDFQRQAEQKSPGLAAEFVYFLLHNKKWWFIPIVVMLLLIGFILVLNGVGLSWVMYPLG